MKIKLEELGRLEKGINEYNVGEVFTGFVLVKDSNKRMTKADKPYLSVTLGDATGDVAVMVWDADEEKESIFKTGNIIKVQGNITEYQSRKQINLQQFRLKNDADDVKLDSLLEAAPIEGEALYKLIYLDVQSMENENLRNITLSILDRYRDDFEVFPAARSVHHAYVSGLAFHTFSMLGIAKDMCKLYPVLNKDLLLSGVIIHDIGKIIEYSGYVATETTLEGKLKGHISIMNEEIGSTAKELGIEGEEVLLLQHMVLSHHGKGEWGSPVAPLIIEAQILHQIDMMDAGLDAYKKAVKDTSKGDFTERIFGLDNRSFYNHSL